MKSVAAILTVLAGQAAAHSIFQELYVNGVSQGHEFGIREPSSNNPIQDVTSDDLICNAGLTATSDIITVAAGDSVTTEWHHTLSGAVSGDADEPIAASHHGPVLAYMAKISDATDSTVTGLEWFKIYEDGYDASTDTWGVDTLIDNAGKVTFKIPSCIEAGNYLLRPEIIALHSATSYPGAQFYMGCAQLTITGGGSSVPSTVSFPGAYAAADPGITINIYGTLTSYTIPGPEVFTCDASAATTSAAVSSVAAVSSTASSSASSVAAVLSTVSSSASSVAAVSSAISSSVSAASSVLSTSYAVPTTFATSIIASSSSSASSAAAIQTSAPVEDDDTCEA